MDSRMGVNLINLLLLLLPMSTYGYCTILKNICYDKPSFVNGSTPVVHSLSHEYCAQLCSDLKLDIAAVTYGKICQCASAMSGIANISTGCGQPCNGNRTQHCGGKFIFNVLTYKCTGPREPEPVYPHLNPCEKGPLVGTPTCDPKLPLDKRLDYLLPRIPQADVVGLLENNAWGVPSLGLPPYQWWSEALHGVGLACYDSNEPNGKKVCPTSFPAGITMGASLNKTLFHAVGSVIGTEGRAIQNEIATPGWAGGFTFWSPNVNIFRDPRWGRGQECPGEDPTINSDYAESFVSGFQMGEDSHHLKASSCCKHFAAYNLDGTSNYHGINRHNFNAIVSEQDLTDTYLPPFRSCVSRGNASGIMCSYNAVNGVPMCANKALLNGTLREKWGFDGYITSDCGAVGDVSGAHKYNTTLESIFLVLDAGMDTECGASFSHRIKYGSPTQFDQAVLDGIVTKRTYNPALRNLFRIQMRLGFFDPRASVPYLNYSHTEYVDTLAHRQLALEAALQGMVLVKNDKSTLPLQNETVGSLVVIGPNGDATKTMQSNYAGGAPYLISPVDGLKKYVVNTTFVKGCNINSSDTSGIAAAVSAAKKADVTVLIVGLDGSLENEAHDRINIALPGVQGQLIDSVAVVAKKLILVIMSGGSVDVSKAKDNSKVGAILIVGYPGQSGGDAIAQTIFGDNNPSGKLTQTWYPSAFTQQCNMTYMGLRPKGTCPGRGGRFYTGTPVFKFGEGLSYTSWDYNHKDAKNTIEVLNFTDVSTAVTNHRELPHRAPVIISFKLSLQNSGLRDGAETVMGFVRGPRAGEGGRPLQQLRRYKKVFVPARKKVEVRLDFTSTDFAHVLKDGILTAEAGEWIIEIGHDTKLTKIVHIF